MQTAKTESRIGHLPGETVYLAGLVGPEPTNRDIFRSAWGGRQLKPPERLAMAVFEAALYEYAENCRTQGQSAERLTAEAWAYFCSEDRAWPYSAQNVCDYFGLELSAVRAALRAGRVPTRAEKARSVASQSGQRPQPCAYRKRNNRKRNGRR